MHPMFVPRELVSLVVEYCCLSPTWPMSTDDEELIIKRIVS